VDPFSLNNTRRFASDSSDEHLLAYATSKTNIAMGEVLQELPSPARHSPDASGETSALLLS
jgi:hypothetical protein